MLFMYNKPNVRLCNNKNGKNQFQAVSSVACLLWHEKMGDMQEESGVGDSSRFLPGGQFMQRTGDKGHFKHFVLIATETEGSASV